MATIWRTLVAVTVSSLVAVGSLPATAQTAEELRESKHVMIRHRLEPAEPVYVGQPVRVWVEVMTRTWFLEAPRYPTALEVRNAIVIPPEAFAVNSSERIGGQSYAVQGRSYTVFPQTTGRFQVPQIEVRLVVAKEDASRSPEITLQTDPTVIEARLPAGAQGHGVVVSTPQLTVTETYDRDLKELRVGDSFKRRVTMTIQDSAAMLLPPMSFEADEGIAVYPGRPQVADRRDRGQMSGTRTDEATYVLEKEGEYLLPETTIWWWNLRTSTLEQEVLPAVDFTVNANPELAAEHLGQPDEEVTALAVEPVSDESGWGWREWVLVLVALGLGTLVLRRIAERSRSEGRDRVEKEESEWVFFHRFETAARANDPAASYRALMSWLDRFEPLDPPASVRSVVRLADDETLTRESDILESMLYGGKSQGAEESWSGGALAAAVRRVRAKLRASERAPHRSFRALPQLNFRDRAYRHQGG
jgi:hypothetical protein